MSAEEETKFTFDEEFQSSITALIVRDSEFHIRTDGLINPEYFNDELEAGIAATYIEYFQKYKTIPRTKAAVTQVIKDAIVARKFRKELVPDIPAKLKAISEHEVDDREFIIDKVGEFAKHQALRSAILESVDLLDKGKFDDIEKKIKQANEVGAGESLGAYNYFELVHERKKLRDAIRSGLVSPTGITTGMPVLDDILFHKGWGRKELSLFMGPPKSGKTMALVDCAMAAVLAGYNVLYVTLEVAAKIIAERSDANLAEFEMQKLALNADEVARRVDAVGSKAGIGKLIIHESPTGTLQPRGLARLLSRYKAKGEKFDLVVVDYLDLMAPDFRSTNSIENSKSIYTGVRAIAQQEDCAILSATQTNRAGLKEAVQRMESVSDDINKIRIADIVISINATEDEKAAREARLYFVASRNQEDGVSIRIKQDLQRAKFVASVVGRE